MAKQDNGKNTPKKTPSSRREIDYSKAKLVKDKPKAEEGWVEGKDPVTGKKMWYRERVTEPDRFPGGPGTPPEPKYPKPAPKIKPSNVKPKPGTPPKLPRKTDSTYEQEVVYMDGVKEEPKNVAAQLDVSGRYEGKENTEYSNPHMRQILFPEAGTGGYTNATQMMTDRTTGKPVDPIKSYDDKGNYVPVFLGDKPYWEIVPKSAVSLAPGQEVNQNSVETMLSNTKNKVARVNTTQEFGKETLTNAGVGDKSEQGIGIGLQDVRTLPSTELKNKSQSPYVNQFEEEKYKNITAPKFKKGGTVKGYAGGGNVPLSDEERKMGYQVRNGKKVDASGKEVADPQKQQQQENLKNNVGSALGAYGTGYFASQGQDETRNVETRNAAMGAVSNMGAIGGVIGGVTAIIDEPAKKEKERVEATDAQGNLKNKDAAINTAIAGSFIDPLQAWETRASYEGGYTDISGEGYAKHLESQAKQKIAEKQFASNMNDRNARINAAEGGTIKGKGGPKSDSILSRINNKGIPSGSFITPAENNDKAKAIRKHILGDNPEKQAQFKKEGGEAKAEVAVSNGEHLFTPAEKKKIIAYLGEEILEELAPNAEENESDDMEGMNEEEMKKHHKEMMKMDMEHKAKGGEISKNKAREIMRDGSVHGKPLTDKQKRYFGWVIGGRKACGGEVKGYKDGGNVPEGTKLGNYYYKKGWWTDANGNKLTKERGDEYTKAYMKQTGGKSKEQRDYEADIKAANEKNSPGYNNPTKSGEELNKLQGTKPSAIGGKKSPSAPKVGAKAQAKQMSEMGAVEPKQISSQELITPAGKVKEEEIKTPISSEELVKMQPDANKVTPTPEKKKWWEGVGNLSEYAAPAFQIGMGLSALNKAGKRPVDAMDKDFIASVEKAKQDATFGYTPEEKFAIDTMNENLTKAARFEARNLSGGSAAVAQSNERAAVNDAYMRGLDSLIKGKQLQMSKQQYANELIAAKQDKSRQLFGDTMTAWMQNQQSGSALLGAGIQNLIGAKRYRDEIEAQKNINQAGKAWTKTI